MEWNGTENIEDNFSGTNEKIRKTPRRVLFARDNDFIVTTDASRNTLGTTLIRITQKDTIAKAERKNNPTNSFSWQVFERGREKHLGRRITVISGGTKSREILPAIFMVS